jgi:hypothetical protein
MLIAATIRSFVRLGWTAMSGAFVSGTPQTSGTDSASPSILDFLLLVASDATSNRKPQASDAAPGGLRLTRCAIIEL